MSIAKVVEITSSSKKSFDDAVRKGVSRASKTIKNIKGAWVNEMTVTVADDEVTEFRVNMKVSFVLED